MHVFQYVLKHKIVAEFSFDSNLNLIPNARMGSIFWKIVNMSMKHAQKIQQVNVLLVINSNKLHYLILHVNINTKRGTGVSPTHFKQLLTWTEFWKIHILY